MSLYQTNVFIKLFKYQKFFNYHEKFKMHRIKSSVFRLIFELSEKRDYSDLFLNIPEQTTYFLPSLPTASWYRVVFQKRPLSTGLL